jgi:hypothetical protein
MRGMHFGPQSLQLVWSDTGDGGWSCTPHGRCQERSPLARSRHCLLEPRTKMGMVNGIGQTVPIVTKLSWC